MPHSLRVICWKSSDSIRQLWYNKNIIKAPLFKYSNLPWFQCANAIINCYLILLRLKSACGGVHHLFFDFVKSKRDDGQVPMP